MFSDKDQLGKILISRGVLDPEQLPFALELAAASKKWLGEILITSGLAGEKDVYRALALQRDLAFKDTVNPHEIDLDKGKGMTLEDIRLMKEYMTVPLKGQGIATSQPEDAERLIIKYGFRKVYVAPPSSLLSAIESVFLNAYTSPITADATDQEIAGSAKELLDVIIRKAILTRASDIHFETAPQACYVRYRIDGDLVPQISYSEKVHRAMTNIIMMRSLGSPSNSRVFDDAAFEYELAPTVKVSMRVSKAPTVLGTSVALRLLRQDQVLKTLASLGFRKPQVETLTRLVQVPNGVILVAGPTGSGKSTTLHALVNEIKGKKTKIVSIEDPVEIKVPFVCQTEVNEKAQITFDSAIKRFLRQDPDTIVVGEIRDQETATNTIEAAMTGHRVLSSVHANTVFDVFIRLLDLGVSVREMANIAAVVNQRLIRRICSCGTGRCDKCAEYDGYYGRVAISEILEVTPELQAFLYGEDLSGFIQGVRNSGFAKLHDVAGEYICDGITSEEMVKKQIW